MERIADNVWKVAGGFPRKVMNVYLIAEDDGVTVFDAGIRTMKTQILGGVASQGKLKRIVLGHAHPDHRGAARGLVDATGTEVWCHEDEKSNAEGDGGVSQMSLDKLAFHERFVFNVIIFGLLDGGSVTVGNTLKEGDTVAGFTVYHMPGHATGQITLFRESDRLALCSDLLYTIDVTTGKDSPPTPPIKAFTVDSDQSRASIRKLADLNPNSVWAGHGRPITENVKEELLLTAER